KSMLPMSTPRTLSFLAIVAAAALAACSKTADAPPPAADPPAAEAAIAPTSPNVKSFTIGELSALSLRDGAMEIPNDNKVFGVGLTPEEVVAVLATAGQPTDKLALSIQPLLVKAKDRVLLFDTGAASLFGPGTGLLLASFTEAGVDPQTVTDIFISHSHGDHVGGLLNSQGALTFPNATIHLSLPEWNHLKGQEHFATLVTAMTPKVDAFTPGAELVSGTVKAVDIKGHTPGHSGYLITSGAQSLLYVGDSMHHFVVSVQKPEWTIAYDGDSPTAAKSRADLIAASAASGQRIYAVHFPFPGIGKFEKQGEGFAWVAE
ncbi:MAG TPA: MBL fold metallo-hydrolase, partial [Steroidobacteraceae bacterium]|nr:MBL fold metallo-hydrolase [Steroidobacteraceae bacterium]